MRDKLLSTKDNKIDEQKGRRSDKLKAFLRSYNVQEDVSP